jgi:hypothetical protein
MALEHTNVIDLIAHDPQTDEVVLVMVEKRAWDGSDLQLFQFQEKLNTYLSFALDGEMAEAYPHFAGKKLRVQLECLEHPDARMNEFIDLVKRQIGFQGVDFVVKVSLKAGDSCGSCGCGGHGHSHDDGEDGHHHDH